MAAAAIASSNCSRMPPPPTPRGFVHEPMGETKFDTLATVPSHSRWPASNYQSYKAWVSLLPTRRPAKKCSARHRKGQFYEGEWAQNVAKVAACVEYSFVESLLIKVRQGNLNTVAGLSWPRSIRVESVSVRQRTGGCTLALALFTFPFQVSE